VPLNVTLLIWLDLATATGDVDDRRAPDDAHQAMRSAQRGGHVEW
jgi:hypothetical protein